MNLFSLIYVIKRQCLSLHIEALNLHLFASHGQGEDEDLR